MSIFGLHLYIYIRKTCDITFTRFKEKTTLGNIQNSFDSIVKLWYLLLQLSKILSVLF